MNAYELADNLRCITHLNNVEQHQTIYQSENMLRQQADRIAELEKETVKHFEEGYRAGYKFCAGMNESTPQTQPLTDEEIEQIANANVDGHASLEQLKWFARAIEAKVRGE